MSITAQRYNLAIVSSVDKCLAYISVNGVPDSTTTLRGDTPGDLHGKLLDMGITQPVKTGVFVTPGTKIDTSITQEQSDQSRRTEGATAARFTPGPWRAGAVGGVYRWVDSPAGDIADVCDFNGDGAANAALISAAPDLYAALQKIHANAAESAEWIRNVTSAALAKAEGR